MYDDASTRASIRLGPRSASASPTARSTSDSVAAKCADTPRLSASAHHATSPSDTPADANSRCCCLTAIRLSDASFSTRVTTRKPSRTAVKSSPAHINNPPSPVSATTGRLRSTSAAPIAAGSAKPIVDKPFETSMPAGSATGHSIVAGNMCAPASTATRTPGAAAAAARTTRSGVRPFSADRSCCRCELTVPPNRSRSQAMFVSCAPIRSRPAAISPTCCEANGT